LTALYWFSKLPDQLKSQNPAAVFKAPHPSNLVFLIRKKMGNPTVNQEHFCPDNVKGTKFEGISFQETADNKIFYYHRLGGVVKRLLYNQYL